MATIPALTLTKTRPKSAQSLDFSRYLTLLEKILQQIQEQTGNNSFSVDTGEQEEVYGVISPFAKAISESSSSSYDTVTSTGVNITTDSSQFIRATAAITVTLNDDPEDLELVTVFVAGYYDITVSSLLTISGDSNLLITKETKVVSFQYFEEFGYWVATSMYERTLDNQKVVRNASDLSSIDSTVSYVIDGEIDMGAQEINVPSGGITINGLGAGVSKLYSSEDSYIMFTGGGNIYANNTTIEVSGSGSSVFGGTASTGSEGITLSGVNFIDCTSLGTLAGYQQFFASVIAMISCDNGLSFAGTWGGGAKITDLLVRNFGSSGSVFDRVSGLSFGTRFFTDANIMLPSGTSSVANFFPADFARDNLFQMTGCNITRNGVSDSTDANYFPNISEASTKSLWLGNVGMKNTNVGSIWKSTVETVTTISVLSDLYKIAGTTVYNNQVHFSNSASNAPTFDESDQATCSVFASVTIEGAQGDEIEVIIRVYDSSSATYVDYFSVVKEIMNLPGSSDQASYTLLDNVTLSQNDRVELWTANHSGTNNVTMLVGSVLTIRKL